MKESAGYILRIVSTVAIGTKVVSLPTTHTHSYMVGVYFWIAIRLLCSSALTNQRVKLQVHFLLLLRLLLLSITNYFQQNPLQTRGRSYYAFMLTTLAVRKCILASRRYVRS